MKDKLKIYKCDFEGMWPVGNCLIIAAYNQEAAEQIAEDTIKHTAQIKVTEVVLNKPQVIGEY